MSVNGWFSKWLGAIKPTVVTKYNIVTYIYYMYIYIYSCIVQKSPKTLLSLSPTTSNPLVNHQNFPYINCVSLPYHHCQLVMSASHSNPFPPNMKHPPETPVNGMKIRYQWGCFRRMGNGILYLILFNAHHYYQYSTIVGFNDGY